VFVGVLLEEGGFLVFLFCQLCRGSSFWCWAGFSRFCWLVTRGAALIMVLGLAHFGCLSRVLGPVAASRRRISASLAVSSVRFCFFFWRRVSFSYVSFVVVDVFFFLFCCFLFSHFLFGTGASTAAGGRMFFFRLSSGGSLVSFVSAGRFGGFFFF